MMMQTMTMFDGKIIDGLLLVLSLPRPPLKVYVPIFGNPQHLGVSKKWVTNDGAEKWSFLVGKIKRGRTIICVCTNP